MSVRQNVEIAKKIQDAYLDTQTYKGRKLRVLFGAWTPLDEWTERCDTKDRPHKKVIGVKTLERHIKNIQLLLRIAKSKSMKMKDESGSPDLWIGEKD